MGPRDQVSYQRAMIDTPVFSGSVKRGSGPTVGDFLDPMDFSPVKSHLTRGPQEWAEKQSEEEREHAAPGMCLI